MLPVYSVHKNETEPCPYPYLSVPVLTWDVAAGIAIVKAAGGNVRFTHGEAKNSLFVSATNGSLPISK